MSTLYVLDGKKKRLFFSHFYRSNSDKEYTKQNRIDDISKPDKPEKKKAKDKCAEK
jgi:hypothetical protein